MKKHKLLLTLGTVAAVAAPIAAVASCGGGSSKGTSANKGTAQTGNVNTNVQADKVSITKTGTFDKASIDSSMVSGQMAQNGTAINAMTPVVYTVSGLAKNHDVKFVFDAASNISEDEINKLITRFLDETNYGYAWLTLEQIIFPSQGLASGAAGYAGAAKDAVVQLPDLNANPAFLSSAAWANASADQKTKAKADNRIAVMQNVFMTLKHEYGHHETSSFMDASGLTQAQALVDHQAILSDVYARIKANPSSAAAEQKVFDDLMNAQQYKSTYGTAQVSDMAKLLGKVYGSTNVSPYDAGFFMNMSYHFSPMEFLNRVMNIVELTKWDDAHPEALLTFPDAVKYELGSRKMFDLNTGIYTQDSHDLVKLYGQYVYGYSSTNKVKIENGEFKAFSAHKFDFIVDGTTTVNVERIVSHYIDKDKVFGETKIVDNEYAYHAKVAATDVTTLHFYEDSNGNGSFDAGVDNEITL